MEPRSRCNNAIHTFNYFKKLGVEESIILDGLSIDKEYLSNPHNWITVKDWYKLIDNCMAAAPLTTLDDWFRIGFNLKDNEESKIFEMITRLVGAKNMYKLAPKYTNSFNTYMSVNLQSIGSDYAEYTIKTDESVIAEGIGLMVRYTSGVCAIIPHVIYGKAAKVDILYDQAHLKNIIEQLYQFYDFNYLERDDYIFINNRRIGRRIQLIKEVPENKIYSNNYSFEKPYNATLVIEDLIVDGRILLHKGDIFDAPYGRVAFKWESKSRFLKVFKSSKLRSEILTHLNEQLFLAEQRHFESERLRAKEKQYIKQLRFALEELASSEERERQSIAEDLHDTVAQTLAMGVSKFKNIVHEKGLEDDDNVIELNGILKQALEEIHSLTFQISPPVLSHFGIEDILDDLSADFNGKYGIQLKFSNKVTNPLMINDTLKSILYRSVRELFMNMVKHSKSKNASLSISQEKGFITIHYADDGIGFDDSILEKHQKSRFGLFSINERIKILNGRFLIDSKTGAGTRIEICIPVVEKLNDTKLMD